MKTQKTFEDILYGIFPHRKSKLLRKTKIVFNRFQRSCRRTNSRNQRECAILFQRLLSSVFDLLNLFVNGPRGASKTTTLYPVAKYCKIGNNGYFTHSTPEKQQTSEEYCKKYGCLPCKVRMFMVKTSGVLFTKRGQFKHNSVTSASILMQKSTILTEMYRTSSKRNEMSTQHIHKNKVEIRSKSDIAHCQNF